MSIQRTFKAPDTRSFHSDEDQFNTDWEQVKSASLPKNVKVRPIEDILASLNDEDFEDTSRPAIRGPRSDRFKVGDKSNTPKTFKKGFYGR